MTKEEALEKLWAMTGLDSASEQVPDQEYFTINVPVHLTPERFGLLMMAYALRENNPDPNPLAGTLPNKLSLETANSLVTEGVVAGLNENGAFEHQVREFIVGEAIENSLGFRGTEGEIYKALLRAVVKAE